MQFIISNKKTEKYEEIENLLQDYINKRQELVYIFEHEAIYTYGNSIQNSEIPKSINNIKTQKSKRGGLWTFHGEGQIICYFALDLKKWFMKNNEKNKFDINFLIEKIEDIIIESLKQIEIKSFRNEQEGRGIWVKDDKQENKKIAFIGLRISKNNMIYGFSINYNNSLDPFKFIKSCDIKTGITSVQELKKNSKIIKIEDFKKIILAKTKLFYNREYIFSE